MNKPLKLPEDIITQDCPRCNAKLRRDDYCGDDYCVICGYRAYPEPEIKVDEGIQPHPGLVGLKGGIKNMWLRHHRQLVIDFYNAHGREATKARFCIVKKTTLDILLDKQPDIELCSSNEVKDLHKHYEYALLKAEIAQAEARDTKREVKELEAQYSRFVELVANEITTKFLIPLLQRTISLPEGFEPMSEADPLSITGLNIKQLQEAKL